MVVVRTVHHVDDFTTPALIECQLRSILDPDRVLVVSRMCRERLADEYGVDATVVTNGVDRARSPSCRLRGGGREASPGRRRGPVPRADGRWYRAPQGQRPPRPRHGPRYAGRLRPSPVLAVVGGHSFQDHRPTGMPCWPRWPALGWSLVATSSSSARSDDEIAAWYHAADAFAFPSVNEGFGLVVLEALAAGTPAVVADLPVFRQYLDNGRDALVVEPGDDEDLAEQLHRLATDHDLRASLIGAGHEVADRFTWSACARQHRAVYDETRLTLGPSVLRMCSEEGQVHRRPARDGRAGGRRR